MTRYSEDPTGFDGDRRPFIRGLDTNDCFNLFKGWFKWGGSMQRWINKQEFPKDTFGQVDYSNLSPEQKLRYDAASSALSDFEDELREVLFEYGESLEASMAANDAYIDGLLDASTRVVFVDKGDEAEIVFTPDEE